MIHIYLRKAEVLSYSALFSLQIRHEKEVIRQNRYVEFLGLAHFAVWRFIILFVYSRIFREKQYAERRLKDFDDALSKEAVRVRVAWKQQLLQTARPFCT